MKPDKETSKSFDQFVDGDEAIRSFPFFYRYFEPYHDDTALVENCNLVKSDFHQSEIHSIGYFFKKTAQVHLSPSDILFKLQ